jgi:hypothetical protein
MDVNFQLLLLSNFHYLVDHTHSNISGDVSGSVVLGHPCFSQNTQV